MHHQAINPKRWNFLDLQVFDFVHFLKEALEKITAEKFYWNLCVRYWDLKFFFGYIGLQIFFCVHVWIKEEAVRELVEIGGTHQKNGKICDEFCVDNVCFQTGKIKKSGMYTLRKWLNSWYILHILKFFFFFFFFFFLVFFWGGGGGGSSKTRLSALFEIFYVF
jgi:hypothetical protein